MSEQISQGMAQTRRAFIGQGALAFLAAAGMGHRAFGATGPARLRFGALSDIHITRGKGSCDIFEKALTYFRDQKVDAVLIAGDMADSGLDSQLRRVGETWRRVFPGDKRPDGEHVEKIFVTGNHDIDGWHYGPARKFGITKEKHGDDILSLHVAEGWKRVFDEDYSPMYVKTVKGYKFVGVHYDHDNGYLKEGAIAAFLESHRGELAGSKPFFYTQHFHPKGTCSAPWAWGEDKGYSTAALSAFPNAVAFTGHSHTPLTDDRTLWRGAFTSIGTASLRFLVLFGGRENSYIWGERDNDFQQMPALTGRDAQHGQLVTVYDDRIVLERRDFANDLPLGPDWIVPLPAYASSFAERAKTEGQEPRQEGDGPDRRDLPEREGARGRRARVRLPGDGGGGGRGPVEDLGDQARLLAALLLGAGEGRRHGVVRVRLLGAASAEQGAHGARAALPLCRLAGQLLRRARQGHPLGVADGRLRRIAPAPCLRLWHGGRLW